MRTSTRTRKLPSEQRIKLCLDALLTGDEPFTARPARQLASSLAEVHEEVRPRYPRERDDLVAFLTRKVAELDEGDASNACVVALDLGDLALMRSAVAAVLRLQARTTALGSAKDFNDWLDAHEARRARRAGRPVAAQVIDFARERARRAAAR